VSGRAGIEVTVSADLAGLASDAVALITRTDGALATSWEYLSYLSNVDLTNQRYIVVSERGVAVSVAPALLTSPATPRLNRPAELLASPDSVGVEVSVSLDAGTAESEFERRLSPSLVLGNLWDARPAMRSGWSALSAAVADKLAETAVVVARQVGARSAVWLHVSPGDGDLAAALESAGYAHGCFGACAEIDLSGMQSFDGYLAAIGRSRRHVVRQDARRFAEGGLSVVRLPVKALEQVVLQEAQNWRRYGDDIDPGALLELRRSLVRSLGTKAHLLGAVNQHGRLLGSALLLSSSTTVYSFRWGADYSMGDLHGSYGVLCCAEPVRMAIASGAVKVNLGTDSYRAKRMRGAQFRVLDAYVCPCDETDRPFVDALVRRLDEHTAVRLAAEGCTPRSDLGDYAGAPSSPDLRRD
jgi:Peptidogalycan biosysnthesis/recognition